MFIQNKYYSLYFSIIENAKRRSIDGYVENHHIIPISLGGSNDSSNLVSLTAREHFVCHRILMKITIGKDKEKMCFAANRMTTSTNADYRISSRAYAIIRRQFAEILSVKFQGSNNPMYGKRDKGRSKVVIFDNITFASFSRLCEYAKKYHGLSRFVMKAYRNRYPEATTFAEYVSILNENNERSRIAGQKNKGKPSPFVGIPTQDRCKALTPSRK